MHEQLILPQDRTRAVGHEYNDNPEHQKNGTEMELSYNRRNCGAILGFRMEWEEIEVVGEDSERRGGCFRDFLVACHRGCVFHIVQRRGLGHSNRVV